MSKRTSSKYKNPNPTLTRRKRQAKSWGYSYTKKEYDQNVKLFVAQDELEQNFSLKGLEKVAKACPGITQAKATAYPATRPSVYLLEVKGREGVCPGHETIDWVGICVSCYLPLGATLRVVGDVDTKSLKEFCRTPSV